MALHWVIQPDCHSYPFFIQYKH